MPKVTLIAHTGLTPDFDRLLQDKMPAVGDETTTASLIEFAGRNCYQSFHRPNQDTNTPEKYIHATVHDKKHYSILEHASASFLLEGVTRAFLAEITRHRHLSFSVESQRFVNSESAEFVLPPALEVLADDELVETGIFEAEAEIREAYRCIKQALEAKGVTGKKAKEAARSILPNSTSVSMVVSGNFRAWLEVLTRRTQPDVDAEFQQVARGILVHLNGVCPEVFGELAEKVLHKPDTSVLGTYLPGEIPEEVDRVSEKHFEEQEGGAKKAIIRWLGDPRGWGFSSSSDSETHGELVIKSGYSAYNPIAEAEGASELKRVLRANAVKVTVNFRHEEGVEHVVTVVTGQSYAYTKLKLLEFLGIETSLSSIRKEEDQLVHTPVQTKVKHLSSLAEAVRAVEEWNIEAGQLDPNNLKWDELPHCRQAVDFLREEVNEVELAAMDLEDDRVELLDGIADVLFTLFGLAAKAGLTDKVEPAFWEVVRSNQTKLIDNKILPGGKVGKGPHYEPPNLGQFFTEGW